LDAPRRGCALRRVASDFIEFNSIVENEFASVTVSLVNFIASPKKQKKKKKRKKVV